MLAHGILGLFVGPIVLAVTWELARAWIREERAELAGPDVEQGTETLAAKAWHLACQGQMAKSGME